MDKVVSVFEDAFLKNFGKQGDFKSGETYEIQICEIAGFSENLLPYEVGGF